MCRKSTSTDNTNVRNAVVVVNENHFGRGPIKSARVTQVDEKSLRPIHTAPQVTATPASFVPRESRGIRPPEKVLERSVVATRTPHPGQGVILRGRAESRRPCESPHQRRALSRCLRSVKRLLPCSVRPSGRARSSAARPIVLRRPRLRRLKATQTS